MKTIYSLLIITLLFFSCKSDDCPSQPVIIDEGEIIKEVTITLDSSVFEQEYIIKNAEENSIGAKVKFENQEDFDFIDFDTYSLLGKSITFSPSGFITKRNITINTSKKSVTCTIEKTECGGNQEILLLQTTWVLTNKFPDDYEVIFNVIKN